MRTAILCFCLLLPTLVNAADVRGLWVGYYAYEGNARVETSFVMEQEGEAIGGVMIEQRTFGELIASPSHLLGTAKDRSVQFEKRYMTNKTDQDAVTYELQLSPDGQTMTGFWRIRQMNGTATFRRVTGESADRIPAPRPTAKP